MAQAVVDVLEAIEIEKEQSAEMSSTIPEDRFPSWRSSQKMRCLMRSNALRC